MQKRRIKNTVHLYFFFLKKNKLSLETYTVLSDTGALLGKAEYQQYQYATAERCAPLPQLMLSPSVNTCDTFQISNIGMQLHQMKLKH
jgi:hypothetical protein